MPKGSIPHRPSSLPVRLADTRRRITYLLRALQLTWSAAKVWTLIWFVLTLLQGILPAAAVYLTKVLVDSLTAALGAGLSWESVRPVLIPAALMGIVLVLSQVLQGITAWIRTAQAEYLQDHIKALVHEKAAAVDLEFYETPEYFDQMARANGEASTRSLSILQNIGLLLQNTVTLVSVAALLIPYSVWLPLVLLVSTLPALWVVIRHHRLHHGWWEKTTEDRRWVEYYDTVLIHPSIAPEVRLFGLNDHFQNAYRQLRHTLRTSKLGLIRDQTVAQFGTGMLALLVTLGTLGWMGARALRGAATLGDLALFYQAFNQGQSLMRSLLSGVGQLYADTLFLEHLYTFLALPQKVKSPDAPRPVPARLQHGIALKNVSFRYPGSSQLALCNFDLFIPAGKTVAIVGVNGAGKTTLTKLLCRFYDPAEGSVEIDGVDLREMDVRELRRRITVLFQYYVNYAGPVSENIAMGDHTAPRDMDRIRRAAWDGGAQELIERLPNGFDTLLGKQFKHGTDLSGGQWQRLALARAFYRQAPIVILDEPTSYMDSWAETQWLERFRRLVHGRTALIVTHRFTTAMRADVIHVMGQGRIVESGSHEELVARGGLYAESWTAQMQATKPRYRRFEIYNDAGDGCTGPSEQVAL